MKAIEIINLSKDFGSQHILKKICLSIDEGEIYGFLGPNGAGKSTTIRCLMNFIYPTDGSISILGKDAIKESTFLKNQIGYLAAEMALNDNWTGREHIAFVQAIKGESKDDKELIERFGIEVDKKVKTLSTGNKQKLAFILALIAKPKLLILDEPTRGLDPLIQNEVRKVLLEFQEKGGAIFISSHDLPEVEHICTKVGIIRNGEIVATESIHLIKNKKLYSVRLDFADDFEISDFNYEGITIQQQQGNELLLKVKGDINVLIGKISKYHIKTLEITHASLEDVFLEYYQSTPYASLS